jgi:type I restriction enzyme, S subunit
VLNKSKPVRALSKSEQLFVLPPGWEWARFNQVASIQSNLVDLKRYKEMPHIAPDNIEGWTARLLPYCSIGEAEVFSSKHLFLAGAILYSKIRLNLAKVTKIEFDGLCSADMYPIQALIDGAFLVKSMIAEDFVSQAVSEDNRVAMPKINQAGNYSPLFDADQAVAPTRRGVRAARIAAKGLRPLSFPVATTEQRSA